MSSGFSGRGRKDLFKERIIFLLSATLILIIIYIIRLATIQIVRNDEFQNEATKVSRRIMTTVAPRGSIYDRNGVPLVQNKSSYSIVIVPGDIENYKIPIVLKNLSKTLNIPIEELEKKVIAEKYDAYEKIEIKGIATLEEVSKIKERIDDFPGVISDPKPIRSYLDIGSLSHVIGYVGSISPEDYAVLKGEGYFENDIIGVQGIEKKYDLQLRGKDGISSRTVDRKGKRISNADTIITQPKMGDNIVLTIDKKIQILAERALGSRVGSVIVLRPSTGEILAMVSYPYIDPNFMYGEKRAEYVVKYGLDRNNPYFNRAIQAKYAPASTFKIVLTAAVINERAFPLDEKVRCTGSLRFGDTEFSCWKTYGHGSLNLAGGLANSCNVFFFTMGKNHLGVERIVKYADDFGYGKRTGIDIAGEGTGILPSPEWKANYTSQGDLWVGGDTVNMSIGQGYLSVTPLQAANAVALIANEGTVYKPKLIKEIRNSQTGDIIKSFEPEILHVSILEPATIKLTQDYMRGVLTDGTARYVISTKAVKIAGKTGTGEVYSKDADSWTSWFIAYGPYDAPPEERIVVVVNVEAVNVWEWWAPKASNAIFQGIFADQTYDEVAATLRHSYLRNNQ